MSIRKLFCLTVVTFLVTDAFGYEERDLIQNRVSCSSLSSNLITDRSWVPYPDYSDRAGWDSLTGANKAVIISCGEDYLDYEWKVLRVTDYLKFNTTGERNAMEKGYYSNLYALSYLLGAELAEGKGRFVPQIADGIYHICEMSSWALSAHIAKFSKGDDAMPLKGDNTLELAQGDLCQTLSWAHYFLRDELDKIHPAISQRIREEVRLRELDPYLERNDYWWMGFTVDKKRGMLNNWNPWCNTNAIITFMLMEENPQRLCDAVWKSIRSVDLYLNFITGDGGIEEGSTYRASSAGMLFNYLNSLSLVTGGKVSIFDCQLIRNLGEFYVRSYVGDGWMVNFADASPRSSYSVAHLLYAYGKATGSRIMTGLASKMRQRPDYSFTPAKNFNRFLESLLVDREMIECQENPDCPLYSWYPQTGFHYDRSGEGLFLAVATGHNGQSHNHNDTGSFILYADNDPVIIDVGVGTYTKQTFSSERYKIWTMQSAFHNLPVINGQMQSYGRSYAAADVKSSPGSVSLEMAGCYPATAEVKTWQRSYKLRGRSLKITDRFDIGNPVRKNEIVFMVRGPVVRTAPGVLTLQSAGQEVLIKYPDSLFDVRTEEIRIDDPKISKVWGEAVFRIVLEAKTLIHKGIYKYEIIKKLKFRTCETPCLEMR